MGEFTLTTSALARLMPLSLVMNAQGTIVAMGPTLAKVLHGQRVIGASFETVLTLRSPAGVVRVADLIARGGERLHLTIGAAAYRGLALPLAGGGVLINLSFGIGVIEAVRQHALTEADFAVTDLAVELLFLVEVKTAVMEELRSLNLRLQGAKVAAEEQALTDTLTGLRNRRALDSVLEGLIGQAEAFGLMHLDLDFFKQVNDTLGHAAGDHVLREVATILRAETRALDTVARVGGDEFAIVLPGQPEVANLTQIARRILEKLARPIDFEGQACRISGSIGLTLSTLYTQPDADRMLCDADSALYASKRAGRGQAQFFALTEQDRGRCDERTVFP